MRLEYREKKQMIEEHEKSIIRPQNRKRIKEEEEDTIKRLPMKQSNYS